MNLHICRRFLPAALSVLFSHLAMAEDRFVLRAPPEQFDQIVAKYNLTVVRFPDAHGISVVSASNPEIEEAIKDELGGDVDDDHGIERDRSVLAPELKRDHRLEQAADPILNALADQTQVPFYGSSAWNSYVNQPASLRTHLVEAHNPLATGSGIIAIIDTGVDPNHPVLKTSLVPGYDFTSDSPETASELGDLSPFVAGTLAQSTAVILDKNSVVVVNQSTAVILDQSTAVILDSTPLPPAFGHGTMVAGIVHLVAPTAKIMPLKAFNGDGTASISNIVRAIYYATDNGASVINMSFSLDQASTELTKAINYAAARGVICVASAGNAGQETVVFPAAFRGVIGVAAADSYDKRSSFSNYGSAIAVVAAPGEGIVTTYPGASYAVVSGTSFAASFVSGGVNLMKQVEEDLTMAKIIHALSKHKIATPDLGYGRIDFYNVLRGLMD